MLTVLSQVQPAKPLLPFMLLQTAGHTLPEPRVCWIATRPKSLVGRTRRHVAGSPRGAINSPQLHAREATGDTLGSSGPLRVRKKRGSKVVEA